MVNGRFFTAWLFPGALGYSAIAVLHAVVQIESGDRAERFVVQAYLAEGFFEIFLEIVKRAEIGSQRRLSLAAGSQEKLLKSAVDERPDFAAHDDAGAFDYSRTVIGQLQNRRA